MTETMTSATTCLSCGVRNGYSHYKDCPKDGIFGQVEPRPTLSVSDDPPTDSAGNVIVGKSFVDRPVATKFDYSIGPMKAPPFATSRSILAEAEALVTGDRGAAYGPPWEDYGRTVAIYNAIRGTKMETAEDGIWFLICVKLSREQNAHGRDNLVDAAGYLKCLHDTIEHNKS